MDCIEKRYFKMAVFFEVLMALFGSYLGHERYQFHSTLEFKEVFIGAAFYFYMSFFVVGFCYLGVIAEKFERGEN